MALYISDDDVIGGEKTSDSVPADITTRPDPAARTIRGGQAPALTRLGFGVGVIVVAVLFGIGGWERRWIADDGLIVLRTVRNLFAGNGPVFNLGERVETNTSPAWTYVVYAAGRLTQMRLEYVVLGLALTLSVAAVVIAMLATGRLHGGAGRSLLLPAGALVYIALPPARDYTTSGLESCLVIFWLAVLWLLLVRWSLAETPRVRLVVGAVFVAGLGPLIRPEMTLVALLALLLVILSPAPVDPAVRIRRVPAWLLRPWSQRILLAAVAGIVPVGYQIWRMGYYGLIYPNTGVAKEANGSKWGQGCTYVWDTAGQHWLWVPLVILVAAGLFSRLTAGHPARSHRRQPQFPKFDSRKISAGMRTPRAVIGLMLLSGSVLTVFLLRVGGDFMHGRMLLPPLFCFLLPIMVLPLRGRPRQWLVPAVAWVGLVVWAISAAGSGLGTVVIGRSGIVDERAYYALNSGHRHPILAEDYLDFPRMRAMVEDIRQTKGGALLINNPSFTSWDFAWPAGHRPPGGFLHTVYFLNLGMTSMNVPLNVRVLDPEGLAYPLAAHTDRLADGRIGHDKSLPADWVIADLGLVAKHPWLPSYFTEDWITQARVALTCPETADMLAAYRSPLGVKRFARNLLHAVSYSKYRIDRVPEYEIQRCGLKPPVLQHPKEN